jgi:heme/copper-type cytochrome/quinol oxidase subunit 4
VSRRGTAGSSGSSVVLVCTAAAAKGLVLCVLVSVLLAFVHLLLELLCFLLIAKRQAGQTVLELEGVEEGTVLVVLERVVDFLVPDDAAVRGLRDG